ncbi:MAG: hypothetical protein J6W98_01720 [Bacteroidales bacterium]|nr:hypothetical protein [Bacteroidales bacterium]
MKKFLLFVLGSAMLVGCSPKISSNLTRSYSPLAEDEEVVVLELGAPVPAEAELLGDISIGDTGFTSTKNGTYEEVLALAKEKARAAGGNVISITNHRTPDGQSTIHRIKGNIYRVPDVSAITQTERTRTEHPDYAVIYFYRNSGLGPLVSYDVHVGETSVYRAKVNTKAEVKIYEAGPVEIWGRTEAKVSFPINIQLGEEYYVRCGINMGLLVGRPELEFVDEHVGYDEYNSVKSK